MEGARKVIRDYRNQVGPAISCSRLRESVLQRDEQVGIIKAWQTIEYQSYTKQTQEKQILVENYRQGSIAPTKRKITLLLTVRKHATLLILWGWYLRGITLFGDTVSVRLDDLISATMLFLIMYE